MHIDIYNGFNKFDNVPCLQTYGFDADTSLGTEPFPDDANVF